MEVGGHQKLSPSYSHWQHLSPAPRASSQSFSPLGFTASGGGPPSHLLPAFPPNHVCPGSSFSKAAGHSHLLSRDTQWATIKGGLDRKVFWLKLKCSEAENSSYPWPPQRTPLQGQDHTQCDLPTMD